MAFLRVWGDPNPVHLLDLPSSKLYSPLPLAGEKGRGMEHPLGGVVCEPRTSGTHHFTYVPLAGAESIGYT